MILVEVSVPALGHRYDFELEESAPVELVLREMVEVICQRERLQAYAQQPFALYGQDSATRLNPKGTLLQNGVHNGQKLLLL
ncbi:EsaB/YukD family protein [uncultured Gemmiger sp.]|uniref:EsaB/YukD family protein n=1 Tax=uncultured Gemmiger sp. TaxID=1623490 RepID=UPI0025E31CBB|nr:EsaB/YukD family protein [uncultured Gemmiger sp.]